ncbi:unnamed protein product [Acanthoscelides obtectus]|uniref:RNase H type-1 domain-containing protein n=1 Tax=Acanthoscelides obtectus TaxID=200917 RepID=A0A9P0Q4H5_ACAOB|nr:unnamed protein product [Acanthoscelides obtectus]CAK1627279.1 hypothetical protein AOBTE_LOCUS4475 [Acanthoscelides obtectus]
MNDGSPTRLVAPNQQVTAPDVTICSRDIAQISHWQLTSDTLGSDHFPILMFIRLSFQVYDTIYPKYKWNMKKANWSLYHDLLEDIFDSTPEFYSTQSKYDYLIEKINAVSEISIPILMPFKAKKRPPPPWWDEQCISAIAQRTSALATYEQDSFLANFVHCKKVFAETKELFKQKSKNSWKAWISKLNKNTSSTDLWKQAKIIRRIPMGKKASTNSDWADDFHRKCSPSFVAAEVEPPPRLHQDNFFSRPFNMTELNLAVKNTRNTSPGCDDITYPMLVNLPSNAKLFLLDIFNNIWLNADTISQWKNIAIVPILKPNMDPNCADSYRPISLLSCMICKVWWGSYQKIAILFFRSYVRSILDYGSIFYGSASKNLLHMLDITQNKFLRKCLGAMQSSPVGPLRVEAQEPPLHLRRQMLSSRFLLKVQHADSHLLSKIHRLNTMDLTCKYWTKSNSLPLCSAIQYANRIQLTSHSQRLIQDISYFHLLSGFDVRVPAYKQQPHHIQNLLREVQSKLAEAIAIFQALQFVEDHNLGNTSIFSDSLSVVSSLKNGSPFDMQNIHLFNIRWKISQLKQRGLRITLVWVKAHSGIIHNEKADDLAKMSITSGTKLDIPLSMQDNRVILKGNLLKRWRSEWIEYCFTNPIRYNLIHPSLPRGYWHENFKIPKKIYFLHHPCENRTWCFSITPCKIKFGPICTVRCL